MGFQASGKARYYLPEKENWKSSKRKSEEILAWEGKMESRQVERRGNTCLGRKNGIQASGKVRKYLPEKEKRNPGKWKDEEILAWEGKMESRQVEERGTN